MDMGAFRGIRRLGGGADGEVWLAAGPDGARVALKVLDLPTDKALDAARRELVLTGRIDHPHLLGARSVVCEGDRVALVMPWAAGGSLADLLSVRGTLSVAQTLTVLIPIADVLAVAHERGVVHGDLSPANILLTADGRPLLADLGAGRLALDGHRPIIGTPGCVAPEVAKGSVAQPSSDVFSLAAIGLWCLTGRPAWNALDLRDVVIQSTVGQWPDPGETSGPPRFLAALRTALSDVPNHRPGAAALRIELARSGEPEPLPIFALGGANASGSGGDPGAALEPGREPGARAEPGAATVRSPAPPAAAGLSEDAGSTQDFGGTEAADHADDVDTPVALQRIRRLMAVGSPTAGAPGRRSDPRASGRQRWWPPVLGVTAAAVICGAAVYGGLSWGRSSAATPVSGAVSVSVSVPVSGTGSVPQLSDPSISTAPTSTAPTSTAPTSTAPTSTAPTSTAPISTAPTSTAPTSTAPTSTAPTSTTPTGSRTVSAGAPAPAPRQSWAEVVGALDARRALALISRDPGVLGEVYSGASPALDSDRATIRRLLDRGWRVGDARHRVRTAELVERPGDGVVRIRVVDELPSYPVTDAGGDTVGRTPARAAATSVLELVREADGYRIRSVHRT